VFEETDIVNMLCICWTNIIQTVMTVQHRSVTLDVYFLSLRCTLSKPTCIKQVVV